MAKRISDELRRQANCIRSLNSKTHTYKDPCKIERLADRIDAEMVELPRDMDGLPIHAGDTVYLEDGRKADVLCVHIARYSTSIDFKTCGDGRIFFEKEPEHFAHTQPDSLKRIADELEGLSVDSMTSDTNLLSSCALDLAKRIRRLAEREG